MADKKISQLTALSAANVAPATDVLAIVDTSATETKKITAKDLIDGALNGGTANGVLYLNGSKVATSGSALVFDGSNLGLGVTPSAWGGGYKAFQIGFTSRSLAQTGSGVGDLTLAFNAVYDATDSRWEYTTTGDKAGRYSQTGNGDHAWYTTGVNGTAGNAISFGDPKMTLDASGNLGVGTTSPSARLDVRSAIGTSVDGSQNINLIDTTSYALGNGGGVSFGYVYNSGGDVIGRASVIKGIKENATNGNYASALTFSTTANSASTTEKARITSGGDFLVRKTASGLSNVGFEVKQVDANTPVIQVTTPGYWTAAFNRQTDDGDIVLFFQADTQEGSISVSGNTVSYNAFAGSHWSQLQDGSKPDILRGTVMESINELCVWPGENNERLPKSKISDTAGSKKVYGVFMAWDNDWTGTNDMYVTAVGAFICRVNGSVTVQEGDLLESNGDGTARVQSDDIIRSSTIGKVTSTVKTHQYDDGSYCVPTVLYCG